MKVKTFAMRLETLYRMGLPISLANAAVNPGWTRQAVIIDTDIMSDVDDVGALAVANILHNCGLADLRGIVVNTQSKYGALATNVRTGHIALGHTLQLNRTGDLLLLWELSHSCSEHTSIEQ